MAAGLPIACSNRNPMPEVLGEAGLYFDPEQPAQIAEAIQQLLEMPELRERCAWLAYERTQDYSWDRCAQETLDFIGQVANLG
jgi:glycosyltransferase involved in cell wall biosynthesis